MSLLSIFEIPTDSVHSGFALGYIVKALADNRLTLKAGVPSDIKGFYDLEGNWPSDRPKKADCLVERVTDGNVKIVANTNALGGKEDHLYKYFLCIGGN
jgi:hypothetical protein